MRTLHIIIARIRTFFLWEVSANLPKITVAIPKNIAKTVPNRKPISASVNNNSAFNSGIIMDGSCLSANEYVLIAVSKNAAVHASLDEIIFCINC